MKICTKCKQEKPLSEFYKHSTSFGLYRSHCKSCINPKKKVIEDGFKRCTKCKKIKSTTDFHNDKKTRDGFYPQCKECTKLYKRGFLTDSKKKLYTDNIVNPICEYFGYCRNDILNTRKSETMVVKFCIFYKLKSLGLSFPDVGSVVGRNHTSILFILKKEGFMSEYNKMQLELFQEFDEEAMERKEVKRKTIKKLYNTINFKEDQELDQRKRIVKIANLLETSYNEALRIVNEMLEQGFKLVPNYYNCTMLKVIA